MTSKAIIAVAADGPAADSVISNHAARCPCYLLFNSAGTMLEVLNNPCETSAGPAAIRAAEFLAEQGTTTLIAADFGHLMESELDTLGIEHLIREGTVQKVIADFIR